MPDARCRNLDVRLSEATPYLMMNMEKNLLCSAEGKNQIRLHFILAGCDPDVIPALIVKLSSSNLASIETM